MDQEGQEEMNLEHYLEIGAITVEGVDEKGEIIFAIDESAKTIAPELWEAHVRYVDDSLLELYEKGLIEVEYNEDLEAILHLSPEAHRLAKEMGLIEINMPEPPND